MSVGMQLEFRVYFYFYLNVCRAHGMYSYVSIMEQYNVQESKCI